MAEAIDTSPIRHLAPFVTFMWGDSNIAQYVRWDTDFSTWKSAPELDIEDWQNGGGATDNPMSIVIGLDRQPIDKMCRPYPHAPVRVVVQEGDPSGADGLSTFRTVFSGLITKSTRNAQGFRKLAKVQVSGWRERLQVSLGAIIDSTCGWTFADGGEGGAKNCNIDPGPLMQTIHIDDIQQNVVNFTVVTGGAVGKNYLAFGSVTVDGLSIFVQSNDGAGQLTLAKQPPPEWLDSDATIMPGCDKRLSTCRKWANEARFGGIGIAIPPYHPNLEGP